MIDSLRVFSFQRIKNLKKTLLLLFCSKDRQRLKKSAVGHSRPLSTGRSGLSERSAALYKSVRPQAQANVLEANRSGLERVARLHLAKNTRGDDADLANSLVQVHFRALHPGLMGLRQAAELPKVDSKAAHSEDGLPQCDNNTHSACSRLAGKIIDFLIKAQSFIKVLNGQTDRGN